MHHIEHTAGWTPNVLALIVLLLAVILVLVCCLVAVATRGRRSRQQNQQLYQSLAEALKARRTAHGMTQEQVAEALGVSRQAVSKWESGAAEPTTSNLLALAKLYGVDLNELLRDIQ